MTFSRYEVKRAGGAAQVKVLGKTELCWQIQQRLFWDQMWLFLNSFLPKEEIMVFFSTKSFEEVTLEAIFPLESRPSTASDPMPQSSPNHHCRQPVHASQFKRLFGGPVFVCPPTRQDSMLSRLLHLAFIALSRFLNYVSVCLLNEWHCTSATSFRMSVILYRGSHDFGTSCDV